MNLYIQALICFGVTLFCIRIYRHIAKSIGLMDAPENHSTHEGHIPLVGGVAIFTAFFFAVLMIPRSLGDMRALFLGIGILIMVGLLDDFSGMKAVGKFVGQMIATVLMIAYGGIMIESVGDLLGKGEVLLGNWAVLFTIICTIAMINATNMLDGIDGLTGGVSLISLGYFGLGYAAMSGGAINLALVVLLCAAVAGFLVFNLRHPWREKASVFLGDAGSMPLGLALTWFAVDLTQGEKAAFTPIIVVWILALPLLDLMSVSLRRGLQGQSPFEPDQTHLHHILLRAGLTVRQTTFVLMGLAAILGGIGIMGWHQGWPEYYLAYSFVLVFIGYYALTHYALRRRD